MEAIADLNLVGGEDSVRCSSHQAALALHNEAMLVAADYKRCEARLFSVIGQLDEKKVYFDFHIASLFEYCVEMLGLSRHTAYNFIDVVRKSREVPALGEAVLSGRTTVSKARKVCSVITPENAKEWIDLTVHCSTRVVEKAVAQANPRAAIYETMEYVSGDTLEFKLAVSEEWSELLVEVKDLLSQKECRAVSSEEALFAVMQEFKRRRDPVEKAKRVEARRQRRSNLVSPARTAGEGSEVSTDDSSSDGRLALSRSRYVPSRVVHAVNLRDGGKCTFVDRRGKRCSSKRWIQRHHKEHFTYGGEHTAENLQTLCWAHHCMEHRQQQLVT